MDTIAEPSVDGNPFSTAERAVTRAAIYRDPEFSKPPSPKQVRETVLGLLRDLRHWALPDVDAIFRDPAWWPYKYLGAVLDDEKVAAEIDAFVYWWAWFREAEPLSETLATFDPFRRYHFVKSIGGKPAIVSWGADGRPVVQSHGEFRAAHLRERTITWPENGRFSNMSLADLWLKTPNEASTFSGVGFFPGVEQRSVSGRLNLWRGWGATRVEVTDDPEVFPPKARRWLEHVREHVCGGDPKVFEYLLCWIADALNRPMASPQTALVLYGPQGSGKGTFAECVLRFFRPHALTLDKPNALTGNFNAHLEDALMVFADEAIFAGDRKAAATMKSLVTSPEIAIERKGFDLYMAPKRFRLIIATNDEHAINADADDRRYLVLRVDAGRFNNDRDYFQAIRDDLEAGGYDELFSWLTGPAWSWMELPPRPVTSALQQQKDLSMRSYQRAVFDTLQTGDPLCEVIHEGDSVFIPTVEFMKAWRLDPVRDATAVGRLLGRLSGRPSERAYVRSAQVRGFWLPSLPECRETWEREAGRESEWTEVSDWANDTTDAQAFETRAWALVQAASKLPPGLREKYETAASLLHRALQD